ncbi:MAG: VanZ family protein [Bacteroidetes bacterium]|nr:VanZ family protein [Bacteroidota bacterium]
MRNLRFFLPAIGWLIITTTLLIIPGNDLPKNEFLQLIHFDKWVHIGLFCGLNFLFILGLIQKGTFSKKTFIICSIACVLYGITMEYVQKYFAFERSFDITDILADTVGVVIGYFVAIYMYNKKIGPCRNRSRNQN